MNYKESLFFIGKCLTISHEKANKTLVEKELASGLVDWDLVTKVSTAHYVFPALYCNLKRANFLMYLPRDLVEYMIFISDLNRNRNLQIIEQAKEINELLLANNIRPIFLKGTGNLLEGLYQDPAERMVGDIDFLVSLENYSRTIDILKRANYVELSKSNPHTFDFRHYPRLIHENYIAAVEIHKDVIINKFKCEFPYENLKNNRIQTAENCFVLSYSHQLLLSVSAFQINDNGQKLNTLALRNAYDAFLLSLKTNGIQSLTKASKIYKPINQFLDLSREVLNYQKSLNLSTKYIDTAFKKRFYKLITDPIANSKHQQKIYRKLILKLVYPILLKSIYQRETRNWLISKLSNNEWRKQKLAQLGIRLRI
uniref:nucleotidyltransferase family protein n=1 Tax=Polaribacter sp. TaxID=1920175 RepID=UPI0040485DBD